MKIRNKKQDNKLNQKLETLAAKDTITHNSAALESEAELQRIRLRLNNDIVGGRTARVQILLGQHPWLADAKLDFGGERHGYIQRGYTPLHLTAGVGRIRLLQLLLEAGADATIVNDDGHLPLYYAVTAPVRPYHARAMGQLLLTAMGAKMQDERQREILLAQTLMALVGAGEVGRQGLMTLCSMNVDVDSRDATGATAVHAATEYDALQTLELLAELDADFNLQDEDGDTPLHRAVLSASVPTIERLLRSGANFRLDNHAGRTPYNIAESSLSFTLIELFNEREENNYFRMVAEVAREKASLHSLSEETEDATEMAAVDNLAEERSIGDWVEAQQAERDQMFNGQPASINEWVWDVENES